MKNNIFLKFIIGCIICFGINATTFASNIDIMPPTGEVIIENASYKDGYYYTIMNNAILNIKASDNVTDKSKLKMLISNTPVTGEEMSNPASWIPYENVIEWKLPENINGASTVYLYLKDEAGNVSPNEIRSTKTYKVTYVADGAVDVPSTQTAVYGMPFNLAIKEPKMGNKYFKGWSMDSEATTESWISDDIIEAKYIVNDVTLYAVWGEEPRELNEVIEVGDFISYPVEYENVTSSLNNTKVQENGWRVLEISEDSVKIITAGTPLNYNKTSTNEQAINDLTTNFLQGTAANYDAYGFKDNLETVFNNLYTEKVESITEEDVNKFINDNISVNLDLSKYGGVLNNGSNYYVAGEADENNLYYIQGIEEKVSSSADGVYGVRPVVTLKNMVKITGRNQEGQWKLDLPKVTVNFDVNGGDSQLKALQYKFGSNYTNLPKPTRMGYGFIGWYTEKDGGEKVTTETVVSSLEEKTFYARWEKNLMDLYDSIPNEPVLSKTGDIMKAVYWLDENGEFEVSGDYYPEGSYQYIKGDGVNDNRTSKWANAMTLDGSYWVWIPRYAYKITYTNSDKTQVSEDKSLFGNIDILFMFGTSDKYYRDVNGNPARLPEGYIVHPAFQAMKEATESVSGEAELGNPLGKWDSELEGIWVAKFEASMEKNIDGTWETVMLDAHTNNTEGMVLTTNAGNTTDDIRVVSKPSVPSWRKISEDYAYRNSLNMYESLNSHLMKNSEYGVVAYLSLSPYGRNGDEVALNQCSNLYTGAGKNIGDDDRMESTVYPYSKETTYDASGNVTAYAFEETFGWKSELGKLSSTTGNIYGIYDVVGGAWEYVATYIDNGHANINSYGGELVSTAEYRNKQVYPSSVNNGASVAEADYKLIEDIYGDAIWETSISYTGTNAWNGAYSSYPTANQPFFRRSGSYSDNRCGIVGFGGYQGTNNRYGGFRPILCVE